MASSSTDSADQDGLKEEAACEEKVPDGGLSNDPEEEMKVASEEGSVMDADKDRDEDSSHGDEATPEWMSFATPECMPEAEVDLLSNFDAMWCHTPETAIEDGGHATNPREERAEQELTIKSVEDLTSEAVWRLVEDRFQAELARAVQEAENRGRRQAQMRRLPRRPKRGERAELVADLMREAGQTASTKAEFLKPAALRLGSGIAKAGIAMQDAGRLVRETSAVVNPSGSVQPPPMPPEVEASRRAKVAQAANLLSSGLKGFTSRIRRQKPVEPQPSL
jgi:hypothetical protein